MIDCWPMYTSLVVVAGASLVVGLAPFFFRGVMLQYFILCNECADELGEDIEEILLAKYGPQGATENDMCVLACVEWDPSHALASSQFFCDECKKAVAVHHSSSWFVDSHRGERE